MPWVCPSPPQGLELKKPPLSRLLGRMELISCVECSRCCAKYFASPAKAMVAPTPPLTALPTEASVFGWWRDHSNKPPSPAAAGAGQCWEGDNTGSVSVWMGLELEGADGSPTSPPRRYLVGSADTPSGCNQGTMTTVL